MAYIASYRVMLYSKHSCPSCICTRRLCILTQMFRILASGFCSSRPYTFSIGITLARPPVVLLYCQLTCTMNIFQKLVLWTDMNSGLVNNTLQLNYSRYVNVNLPYIYTYIYLIILHLYLQLLTLQSLDCVILY